MQNKPSDQPEFQNARECDETFGDSKLPHERFDPQQTEDNLFRRRLATLGDSALSAAYMERRTQALSSGEFPKLAAKKTPGGAK